MQSYLIIFCLAILMAGCAASTPHWRDDAYSRFNSAVTAGAQQTAPEEADNIRQTLKLADRYLNWQMIDDADRLYQLSCLKSQLLYRNLVLSKVRQGASLIVESENGSMPEEIAIDREPVSIRDVVDQAELSAETDPTAEIVASQHSPDSDLKNTKKHSGLSRQHKSAGQPSTRIRPELTTIYLTFDDGPSRLTLPIASFLKSQEVAATFFVLGNNIRGHEKDIRATVAMGHRVGNHTLSHDLRKLDASFQQETSEVVKTAAMIEKLGGDGRMVRIPYGASKKALISKVSGEGGQIFDWDIDSNDSTKRGVKNSTLIEHTVINQLKKSGKRHVIILFHDGSGHEATLKAVRNLVPRLKHEGYRFGLLYSRDRVAGSKQLQNPQL